MSAATFAGAAIAASSGEINRSAEIEYVSHTFEGAKTESKGAELAIARVAFNTLGTLTEITDVGNPAPAISAGEWHRDEAGAGLGDDWEIRATVTAGTDPTAGDALDTWLRLNTIRQWDNTRLDDTDGVGTTTTTLRFEWRLFGGSTIQKTVNGTIIRAVINA